MTALQMVRLFDGFDVFDHRKHIRGCYRQLRDHRSIGKVVFDLDSVGIIGFENVNVIDVEIAELAVFPQFPPLSDLTPPGNVVFHCRLFCSIHSRAVSAAFSGRLSVIGVPLRRVGLLYPICQTRLDQQPPNYGQSVRVQPRGSTRKTHRDLRQSC